MKFTLCIPAHNEERIIVETLTELSRHLSVLPKGIVWNIVVADSGSSDGTADAVRESPIPNTSVQIVKEKGKGLALRSVARECDADIFGFIDADLSADAASIAPMLAVLNEGHADIVIGSRLINKASVHRNFLRTVSSEVFNVFQRAILGLQIKDTQCGLKLMNKKGLEVFRRCTERSWFFDLEFLARARFQGLKTLEVPVAWEEFRYKDRASKLNVVWEGFSAIIAMVRIRSALGKQPLSK